VRLPDVLARVVRLNEALEGVLPTIRQALDGGDLEELHFVTNGLRGLEAELGEAVYNHRARTCPECGLDCKWPGRLDEHIRVVHPGVWEARHAA
jgi:hypothetical protein